MSHFTNEELIKATRAHFFASKYSTVEQFTRYSGLWPAELGKRQFNNWNYEKRAFLQKELSKDSALAETYKMNLSERLSLVSQIIDLITVEIANLKGIEPKDLKLFVDTFEKLTTIQDKTIALMKVDAVRENEFNKNKESILGALQTKQRRTI